MASALVGLGQMFAIAISSNRAARVLTYTTVLAEQKLEQLRGLAWAFDDRGQPVSDAALSPSPADTMTSNTPGWVDYVDQFGEVLGEGAMLPPKTVYIRRWAVEPLPVDPANTIVIHVLVTARINRGVADRAASSPDSRRDTRPSPKRRPRPSLPGCARASVPSARRRSSTL